MEKARAFVGVGVLLVAMVALGAVACAPAPEPTAAPPQPTTAPPTATTAPVEPAATTAVAAPTVAVVEEVKYRPIPILQVPPNPKAKHGGILRKLGTTDTPDFGIWDSAQGGSLEVGVPTTDSVLNRNEFQDGKNHEILANLAYDWWTDKEGVKWTFKLQQGVKHSDGVPFTCADVKFSLDTIRLGRDATGDELRRSPRGAWMTRVTEIRCPDDHTLEIDTDGPLPSLPASLAVGSYAVMAKHIYEGNLDLWLTALGPGIGPFIFKEYRPTESVELVRNPNYWNQPYPYLDGLKILYLGSAAAAQAAMRVGRGESGGVGPRAVREEYEKAGKIQVTGKQAGDGFTAWHPNNRRQPWGDKRFALAVRCALDGRKMIDTVFDGLGFEGPLFPLATDPGGAEWALTKEEWKAIGPCYGPTAETDMNKRREIARGLLKEMGFGPANPAKPDWVIWKEATENWIPPTDEDMRAVGIEPQFRILVTALYYEAAALGNFDVIPGYFVTSRRDPDHWLYEHYLSTSNRNYGAYTNAEVDVLIEQQSKALDKEKRKSIIKEIQKILLKDNAKVVINHNFSAFTFAPWVKDVYWGEPSNSQNTSAHFTRAWIDQDVKKSLGY